MQKGEVKINGYDIRKNFTKAIEHVGAIVENPDTYMYLTGRENLELNRQMYKNIPKERIEELIDLVGLRERIDDKVSKYSLGMRQRLGIAVAMINNPNVLILDEPTNGLDPEGMKELRDFLRKLALEENIAILISSHNLAEIESLCTKISIIQKGKIIQTDSIEKIKSESIASKYHFRIDKVLTKEMQKQIVDEIVDVAAVDEKEIAFKVLSENSFAINVNEENIPSIMKRLLEDIRIYEVYKEKRTLEDAFIGKTGGNKIV